MKTAPETCPDPVLPRRRERGSTFIELMLAVLVISTTIVASSSSMRSSVEVYHFFADGAHEALLLAQEVHEAALLLPWQPDDEAQFGPDVHELADLDDMTFSPPRSADYSIVTSHIGWSQVVEVNTVDLMDPTVEVDPETFPGETLTELKVSVKSGALVVGEFSWWMTDPAAQ
ncbi:MAG: type IV pilus modification PilV family protein [Planctomycetota bacterium]